MPKEFKIIHFAIDNINIMFSFTEYLFKSFQNHEKSNTTKHHQIKEK